MNRCQGGRLTPGGACVCAGEGCLPSGSYSPNHLQRSVIVHYVFGGHPAISAICSRHEPVQELGGKPRGVGGNLFISGIFYFLIFCHVKYLTSILSIIVYYRKCDETTSWRVNWTSMEKEARN